MQKLLLLTLFLLGMSYVFFGQAVTTDSLGKLIEKGDKQIVTAIAGQTKEIKEGLATAAVKGSVALLKPNTMVADFITFFPVILFIIILFTVMIKLKRDNVKLSDFLIDKDTQVAIKKEQASIEIAKANANIATANAIRANAPVYAAANVAPPEIPAAPIGNDNDGQATSPKEQSTSRLLAFISGITSVALAACIATFYFYRSFLGESNVSIGNLANVLYGLGLGVIPYGFNKIANALK
jgi:hypothetical protein